MLLEKIKDERIKQVVKLRNPANGLRREIVKKKSAKIKKLKIIGKNELKIWNKVENILI